LKAEPLGMIGLAGRAKLPELRMSYVEFKALPEYSATHPTGTTIGKRWRRHDGAHDPIFRQRGGIPIWYVLEYVAHPDPKLVGIKTYRPVIRVPCGREVVGLA
jgi:hypothetical protein